MWHHLCCLYAQFAETPIGQGIWGELGVKDVFTPTVNYHAVLLSELPAIWASVIALMLLITSVTCLVSVSDRWINWFWILWQMHVHRLHRSGYAPDSAVRITLGVADQEITSIFAFSQCCPCRQRKLWKKFQISCSAIKILQEHYTERHTEHIVCIANPIVHYAVLYRTTQS